MISVIIDTCALYASKQKDWPCSITSGKPYSLRIPILRDQIVPRYLDDPLISEVIIVASDPDWDFPTNDKLKLVVKPEPDGKAHGPWTIDKRHAGFLASTKKLLVFHHDDHVLGPGITQLIIEKYLPDPAWGALAASRWVKDKDGSEGRAIDGWYDGYMTTNGFVIHRHVVEKTTWDACPRKKFWDILYSKLLIDAGVTLLRAEDIRFYDVEMGVMP